MTDSIKNYVGKVVGYVRISKPVENLNNGYECAAWWQKELSETGVFPITCVEDYHRKGTYYGSVELPARVTDCYFGSLFCGNPIGKYDKTHDVATRRAVIRLRIQFPDAIAKTGNSADEKQDVYLAPSFWPIVLAYWQAELARLYASLPNWWNEYQAGENEFFSRVGMVAACGGWIEEAGRNCEEIQRRLKHWKGVCDKDYIVKNIAWVPTA